MLFSIVHNGIEVKNLIKLVDNFLISSRWIVSLLQIVSLNSMRNQMKRQLIPKCFGEGYQPLFCYSGVKGNIVLIINISSIQIVCQDVSCQSFSTNLRGFLRCRWGFGISECPHYYLLVSIIIFCLQKCFGVVQSLIIILKINIFPILNDMTQIVSIEQ